MRAAVVLALAAAPARAADDPVARARQLYNQRQFNAAIAATTAGGEVVALDSAGYGPTTITGSIALIGAPGIHAGISVFSGVFVLI